MGEEFLAQLTFNSQALKMVSGVLVIFAIVPGLPAVPFLVLAALLFVVARLSADRGSGRRRDGQEERRAAQGKAHIRGHARGSAGPAAPGYA